MTQLYPSGDYAWHKDGGLIKIFAIGNGSVSKNKIIFHYINRAKSHWGKGLLQGDISEVLRKANIKSRGIES